MKKTNMIVAIAIGLGFLLSSSIQAIHPVHYTELLLNVKTGMNIEKELAVQDWMLSPEAFSRVTENSGEPQLEIKSWMLDGSEWLQSGSPAVSEPEVTVEEWMIRIADREPGTIALGDRMLRIAG